jgi:hypothetical protein
VVRISRLLYQKAKNVKEGKKRRGTLFSSLKKTNKKKMKKEEKKTFKTGA